MPLPPIAFNGLTTMSPCSARNSRIIAASLLTRVGAMNCGETRDRQLLVVIAQGLRPVEHPRALPFGHFQQPGGVQIGLIERRIGTHDHRIEIRQIAPFGFAPSKPRIAAGELNRMHRPDDLSIAPGQIAASIADSRMAAPVASTIMA
jgi:hypothetical protein